MRDFLINTAPYLVWILAVLETLTAVICIKTSKTTLGYLAAAVSVGLAVDAAIMASGVMIGEGQLLASLSQFRFILHGILVPLLIPISFYAYGAKSRTVINIVWFLTSALIVCGVIMGFTTVIEPLYFAGILRYGQSSLTPEFARTVNLVLSFGGVIPLIVVGFIHLFKNKSPYLLLSGLFMFAFSALGPATHNMDLNFLITMIGEDLMVLFFSLELIRQSK